MMRTTLVPSIALKALCRHSRATTTTTTTTTRGFSASRRLSASNQIFDPIRDAPTFQTHHLLALSSRTPFITLWTTSWCPACRTIAPLLQTVVSSGVGEAEGGVAYAVVELDAPDVVAEGLGLRYGITAVPTLVAFGGAGAGGGGAPRAETKVVDARVLGDRRVLEEWVRTGLSAASCYLVALCLDHEWWRG
ncbi:uncharacterized protein GGS25DRAFT_524416 [Hypoxylon fragiforme]|uniref:uncharacterized protein n=1 Tax=Hypoxylon fragiforme TaxID=63214 RepID=UPI0020C63032|nr:uncharacterized protein GGS25DRAFT_524416 [Hypoxylon fragiforme]KAI2604921.1 hypothetical protein GGS25DRAFT_524416 [Hypoxylon fragiforme]